MIEARVARRAESLVGHGATQLIVFKLFACGLHSTQKGGFRIASGRFGLHGGNNDVLHCGRLARRHWRKHFALRTSLAGHFKPAWFNKDLAFGLELMRSDSRDANRHVILSCRKEDCKEATNNQIKYLLLDFIEGLWKLSGRNNGKVIADLGVVKDALVRTNPVLCQNFRGKTSVVP